MTKPTVYLICGPTGAGKSTHSKALIAQHRALYFSIDEWMKTLFWMDAPTPPGLDWALERVTRCETLIWSQTKAAVAVGSSVVLDLGFSEPEQRKKFYDLLRAEGFAYELHYLDTPVEERWRRVEERNRALDQTSIGVTRETFDWMEGYFQKPSQEEIEAHFGCKI